MELIVSHISADFDALGSMVGARRLYPDAVLALTGSASRAVRDYLSMHREMLDLRVAREIAPDTLTRIIVVDTARSSRLGEAQELLTRSGAEVHLIDHHLDEETDLNPAHSIRQPVGANCTLIAQELERRQIRLTPFEATVMLLGIYEDTGFLAYRGTRPEDLEAAAWLIRAGGELSVVREFTRRLLTTEQRHLFAELLSNAESLNIQGLRVCLSTAPEGPFVDDLAVLVQRLLDTEGAQAAFALTPMHGSLYVVGRSRGEALDVGAVLRELGGGGHVRAGSASLHHTDLEAVRAQLLEAIADHAQAEPLARDIMSTPVRTVLADESIAEARRQMQRYGHSGVVVLDRGAIAGVLTRRDADKARQHHLGHAPVRGFMSRDVQTVSPQAPLSELQERMIEAAVGRLPVVEHGQLTGIVTRTDVLRALHGARYVQRSGARDANDAAALLRERLPAGLQHRLGEIGEIAAASGTQVFAVGGFVRDLFWGDRNLDVDLVVEPDALELAQAVADKLGGEMKTHQRFQTATVTFADGFKIDFSTARTETYSRPGALPEVEPSTILDDLRRRDFSINAMAVNLVPERYGRLLDPFHGRADQERRRLRVLHNLSFIEDPTRLFRAARFAGRFHFDLDATSAALALEAVKSGALDTLSPERACRQLRQVIEEENAVGTLYRLREWGMLEWLSPAVGVDGEILPNIPGAMEWWRETSESEDTPPDLLLVYLGALMRTADATPAAEAVAAKLRLSGAVAERLTAAIVAGQTASARLGAGIRPSEMTEWLASLPSEALVLLRATATSKTERDALDRYMGEWRHVGLGVDGNSLQERGWAPGPALGAALKATLAAKIDGSLVDAEQEIAHAEQLLAEGEQTKK